LQIHEIDLKRVVRKRRFGVDLSRHETSNGDTETTFPWGFVGNGLWRDVFSCDPHQEVDPYKDMPPAVLKMMKSEHPYDQRNFQRHRRDALVMELLSSSHHLVPIYGYCANTVLTQAISHTLDDVIYAREKESVKSWSPEGGYKTKPKIESWMGRDESGELVATRETESGRIKLALGVFRGLMDLHEGVGYKNKEGKAVEWLPIIHADLQAKQYLVDSVTGDIYLNDFNRCRFVTKKENVITSNSSLEACPVYIPTSPGSSRSPEEYDSSPLTEKLDVYSAGNILFGIITGERPWGGQRGKHIKSSIQRGDRPEINETVRDAVGTVDAELTRLLDRVYEGDPTKRASAHEIVFELEKLSEAHRKD
jgi:serine/threonine protein kinase